MRSLGPKIFKPIRILNEVVEPQQQGDEKVVNQLSQKNLERLRKLTKTVFKSTLTFDEQLTNNTFDDHMSCQTFFQCLPQVDNQDLSDDHMCSYKRKYLLDQLDKLKNVLSNQNNPQFHVQITTYRIESQIQMITRALQQHQDQFEQKSDIPTAAMTDEEITSLRQFDIMKFAIYKSQDRQMRIQRYKNKKLKRNWDKKISYVCRKQVAQKRPRIKGRFISKSDQKQIDNLLDHNAPQDVYDDKRNLDIEKFHNQTNLFNHTQDPKKIPKREILSMIRDEFKFKKQQKKIVKLIKNKQQIFRIIRKKPC